MLTRSSPTLWGHSKSPCFFDAPRKEGSFLRCDRTDAKRGKYVDEKGMRDRFHGKIFYKFGRISFTKLLDGGKIKLYHRSI